MSEDHCGNAISNERNSTQTQHSTQQPAPTPGQLAPSCLSFAPPLLQQLQQPPPPAGAPPGYNERPAAEIQDCRWRSGNAVAGSSHPTIADQPPVVHTQLPASAAPLGWEDGPQVAARDNRDDPFQPEPPRLFKAPPPAGQLATLQGPPPQAPPAAPQHRACTHSTRPTTQSPPPTIPATHERLQQILKPPH